MQILTWAIPAKLSVIASSLLKREIIRFSHCFCVPNCPVVRGQQKFSCRRAFELNENWLQPRDVWFQICVRKLPLSVIWNLLTDSFVEEGNFPQFRCFIVSSEKTVWRLSYSDWLWIYEKLSCPCNSSNCFLFQFIRKFMECNGKRKQPFS